MTLTPNQTRLCVLAYGNPSGVPATASGQGHDGDEVTDLVAWGVVAMVRDRLHLTDVGVQLVLDRDPSIAIWRPRF
jgi:hypothetical protein